MFGRMSSTQSRMGQMGMSGNRPGDGPSLGGRFGSQPPPRSSGGSRFSIGPSRPPMPSGGMNRPMPPKAQGNAFGRMSEGPMRQIVRPPTGINNGMGGQVQLPPPMQGAMSEQGSIGPRPDLLERFRAMMAGGGGPMRGFN